jgi:4-amino-4-deoxy-L-arabinose transferase-like glycosyltransferase
VKAPSRETAVVIVVLGALALLIAAARLHTYHEPLERDITSAAVIAREMLVGRSLYSDMWDHKPPGVHITHAISILLVGHGPGAIYLINVAAAVATLLGVYFAAAAVGGLSAGLWGAAFWALVSGDLWLQANQPNAEVFINACLAWAFALLVRASGQPRIRRMMLVGGLFALASLYKPVAVAPAVLLAVGHVIVPPAGCPRRRAVVDVFVIGGVGAVAWVATLGYFAAVGHFADFYQAVFAYNHFYSVHNARGSESILTNLGDGFRLDVLCPSFLLDVLPLGLFSLVGGARGAKVGPGRPWGLLLAYGIGAQLAVALPGQYHPHYYQLWLPPLTIGAGWALGSFVRIAGIPRWTPHAAGVAVIVLMLAEQLPLYQVSPEAWSRLKYGELFVREQKLGRELGALLGPGETFYEWGAETGLYFESKHSPPSGAFYVFPLLAGPAAMPLASRAVADLDRHPPMMFVVNRGVLFEGRLRHPVLDWAQPRYVALAGTSDRGTFVLFVRRGSRLDVSLAK